MNKLIFLIFLFCLAGVPSLAFDLKADHKTPLVIEADKGLEWNQNERVYIARGNALAKQGDSSITAEELKAFYTDENGSNEIQKIVATGRVFIKTATDQATGDRATYDAATGLAQITGENVVIKQGDNQITGTYAEVNMNTGLAKMVADPASGGQGRVRAVFTPSKDEGNSRE